MFGNFVCHVVQHVLHARNCVRKRHEHMSPDCLRLRCFRYFRCCSRRRRRLGRADPFSYGIIGSCGFDAARFDFDIGLQLGAVGACLTCINLSIVTIVCELDICS